MNTDNGEIVNQRQYFMKIKSCYDPAFNFLLMLTLWFSSDSLPGDELKNDKNNKNGKNQETTVLILRE